MVDLVRRHCSRCNQGVAGQGPWCSLYSYQWLCVGKEMDRHAIQQAREARARCTHDTTELTGGDEIRCMVCGVTLAVADG